MRLKGSFFFLIHKLIQNMLCGFAYLKHLNNYLKICDNQSSFLAREHLHFLMLFKQAISCNCYFIILQEKTLIF